MRYTKAMEAKKQLKYYRHKIDNLLVVSRIVTVHYFEFDKGFTSEGEAHDFWEMVYVDGGHLVCTAGEATTVLSAGECMFHRPGEFHRHAADGKTAPRVFIVSFECRSEGMRFFEGRRMLLPPDCARYVRAIVAEATATFNIPVSDPMAKKMELLPAPILGGTQMIKNRLEMLLILLLRSESSREGEETLFLRDEGAGGKVADAIVARMREGPYSALSVDELCEGIAYSRSYIFKEFRAATGHTIADYYNEMRVGEAKRLLRVGNRTIAEIAALLHFDTPNYFGKTFKRYTGLTPRAYRTRVRTRGGA